ncbi:MAG: PorV/PorQ family protein [Gemmatimonadaceae bacterium]
MTYRRLATIMGCLMGCLALAPAALPAQIGAIQITPTRGENVSRVGTRGANFLQLGVGARPLALAGVYAASASDLSSVYWNVAGLAEVQRPAVFLSRETLYGSSGLTNTFAAASLPVLSGTLGVSFTSFTSGDITRTTEAYPEGNDPVAGSFVSWSANAVGVHYARQFTDRLAFGLTGKYATEGITFATAKYYGFDAGTRFRSGLFGTTLGASVSNLGSASRVRGPAVDRKCPRRDQPLFPTQRTLDCSLPTGQNQLPTMLRFGIQTDIVGGAESLMGQRGPHRLALMADINDGIDSNVMPAVAAEYVLSNRLSLRVGKRFLHDGRTEAGGTDGLGGGIGLAIPLFGRRVLVDYAYRDYGDLSNNQAFSFQFEF